VKSLTQAIQQAFARRLASPPTRHPSRSASAYSGWPELPDQPQVRRRASDPHPWADERPAPLAQPGVRNLR